MEGPSCLAAHITADTPENPYKLNVVFVTDIDLISDWFFYNRSRGESNLDFDNVTFVLNAVDVLAGDKTFLELRKRRPELRTLTGVERRTAAFVEERIRKTKEADDEAKKLLQKAQHQFDDKRAEIEKDPKLSPPEKEELIRRLKEGEERRLDVAKAGIDRQKQQEIDEIKNATERQHPGDRAAGHGERPSSSLPSRRSCWASLSFCCGWVGSGGTSRRSGASSTNNAKSDRRQPEVVPIGFPMRVRVPPAELGRLARGKTRPRRAVDVTPDSEQRNKSTVNGRYSR